MLKHFIGAALLTNLLLFVCVRETSFSLLCPDMLCIGTIPTSSEPNRMRRLMRQLVTT